MITQKIRRKENTLKKCFFHFLRVLAVYMAIPLYVYGAPNEFTVSGRVVDSEGDALIGVSIAVAKTSIGTITDINGAYKLTAPNPNAELRFSYMGYQTQTVNIRGRSIVNIVMQIDAYEFEELVVVGFGTQKKETVTGAIASINTKDLLQSPQANISNALAGRIPGVITTQRSGLPGADQSTIRIRGIGTFVDSDDYTGSNAQAPLVMIDGVESESFDNIDPSEIESLTVLKDASATAVYGVRGANGVILITTLRGVQGKPKISLSTNVATSDFPFLRKSMNSYEYATRYNLAKQYDSYVNGSYHPKYSDFEIERYRLGDDPIFYPDMDWYDYVLKDYSVQTQTNFNVRGGTDRVKYFVSLGYFTQEGMFNDSHYDPGYDYQARYKRYNLRSNFDIDLTKNLSAGFDISTQISDLRNPNWSIEGLMASLTTTIPMSSPGVIDNKIVSIPQGNPPVIPFDKGYNRSYENNLNGSLRLNYKMDYLLNGLSLRGLVSYRNFNSDKKTYNLTETPTYYAQRTSTGYYLLKSGDTSSQFGWDIGKHTRIQTEAGVYYDRKLGPHAVTGLLLYNQSKYYSPDLQYLVPSGIQGLAGRVTYNYSSRYLLEFNIGYNGTENFAKGRRFGTFPAYSLGWVLTEEPFFPRNDYLTFLKIRATHGTVGNDRIGNERFLYRPSVYLYETNAYFFGPQVNYQSGGVSGALGSLEGKIGNPLVTWEKAVKQNIGADIKFRKDKIALTFDYFVENRSDILWQRGTTPAIIGADMPIYNLGRMKNSGWDGEFSYFEKIRKVDFFVKTTFSYAHNVIEYQDEVPRNYPHMERTGQRYGQFFGYVADGLYNSWKEVNDPNRPDYTALGTNRIQPGDIKYVDINGDGKIDQNDEVPIGYSNFPEIMYGVALGMEWNGWDASVLFQGADRVSTVPSRSIRRGFFEESGANKELLKSWTQERYEQGLEIAFPRLSADDGGHNYYNSTYWVENARYLRLKNAEIGYTFRQNFIKKAGIRSIRLYANGSNLLTWCNLFEGEDPESPTGGNGDQYPVTRIFNLGLNINF
jgi:TonB-linked SusC/RagA family outer membrane protein